MKKNILFSICLAVFAFMGFMVDASAETEKVCNYDNTLATFACNKETIYKVDSVVKSGDTCQINFFGTIKNKEYVTIENVGSGSQICSSNKFSIRRLNDTTCNVYGSCKEEHGVKICNYDAPLTSFACDKNQNLNISDAKSINGDDCVLEMYSASADNKSVTLKIASGGVIDCSVSTVTAVYSSNNMCNVNPCRYEYVEDNNYSDNGVIYNTCTISCGNVKGIPENLPTFVRRLINIVKVLVPVILIIMGIVDFFKAMTSSNEKDMSEAPRRFVRRIIVSVLIFLVIVVVQFVIRLISDASSKNGGDKNPVAGIAECISCFTSDSRSCGEAVCK